MADSRESLPDIVREHKAWLTSTKQLCQQADDVLETFQKSVLESGHDGMPSVESFCFPSDEEKAIIKRILDNKASIVVTGRTNSGKSSLLNAVFRTRILPVHENPCTARVVRLVYCPGQQYQRLLSHNGSEVEKENIKSGRDVYKSKFIKMDDDTRQNKQLATMTVEVGLNHKLLESGIEVLDSPGKSENEVLDNVVDNLLKSGQIPLIIYVIDGRQGLMIQDIVNLEAVQSKLPNCTIMFVCNKCDDDKVALAYDNSSGEDEDEEEDDDGVRMSVSAMKEAVFNKLKTRGFIHQDEELETCKNFHGLSARAASENYKKTRCVGGNFDKFEQDLIHVLFEVLQNDICKVITITMNNLASCSTIFEWALLDRGGSQDMDALFLTVEEAEKVSKRWYDELCNVMNIDDIRSHMEFTMTMIERELFAEVWNLSSKEGHFTSEDDLQYFQLMSKLSEIGFDPDMEKKGTFCHAVRKLFASYLFNTFRVALEMRYKEKLDVMSTELVNLMFTIAPSLRDLLKRSYRVRPSAMFDCDQLLSCTGILFDVLQTILNAARVTLRAKIDSLCDNESIMFILKADNQVFSEHWCRMFAKSLLDSVDISLLVLEIQQAALKQVNEMFSNFTNSLRMIRAISNDVKKQEDSVLTRNRSQFTIQHLLCQAQAYGIHTSMMYPHLVENLDARIAVSQTGSPVYKCRNEYSGGFGLNIALKKVTHTDKARQEQLLCQLLKTSEIQHHSNRLMLYGWILPSPLTTYIVMERAETDLIGVVQQGCIYLQRLTYGVQIGQALLHLAAQNPPYYYMDIKPRNILIGQDGQAKINICKPEDFLRETAEIRLPFHISPQLFSALQRGGESAPHPSNQIFAYGALLWVLVHGRIEAPPAYRFCDDQAQLQAKIADGVLPDVIGAAPKEHWAIIDRCLKRYEEEDLQSVVSVLGQKVKEANVGDQLSSQFQLNLC